MVTQAPPAAVGYTRCTVHPEQRAGWRCTTCERTLCPDCTSNRRPAMGAVISVCVHCGGLAVPLVRKKKIDSYLQALPRFLGSLFTMDGVTTIVALGLVLYVLSAIGLGAPATALLITYMFTVIQAAAQGAERLPDPADFIGAWSLILPVLRFAVASSYIWLPGILYVSFVLTWESLYWDGPIYVMTDPILLALLVVGIMYYPIAVVLAAISDSLLAVLDFRIGFRIIARLPLQYAGAALLSFAFMLLGWVYGLWASIAVSLLPIPILPGVFTASVGAVFWLVPGWILGRFIFQNATHFGLLLQGADEELEWPEAQARAPYAPEGSQTAQPVQATPIDGWDRREEGLSRAADTLAHVPDDARQIQAPRREVEPLEVEGWSGGAGDKVGARGGYVVNNDLELGWSNPPTAAPETASIELDLDGTAELPKRAAFRPGSHTGAAGDPPIFDPPASDPPAFSGGAEVSGPVPLLGEPTLADMRGGSDGSSPIGSPLPLSTADLVEIVPAAVPGAPLAPGPATGATQGPSPVSAQISDVPRVMGRPLHAPEPAAFGGPEGVADPHAALETALNNEPGVVALTAFVRCRDARVPLALPPALELRLATVLERAREFEAAVAACRRAADQNLNGPLAPRAIFMAAQLHEQRLGDAPRAAALYRYLVDTFPQDQLASRAREAINRLG